VYREVLERIAALPGVSAAGFGNAVPLEGGGMTGTISIEGRSGTAVEPQPVRRFLGVGPGYFAALGTRLFAGRDLAWPDLDDRRNVVLVSAALASDLWGEPQAAIGKRIRVQAASGPGVWQEIIGVTQDVYQDGPHRPPPSTVYTPLITEGSDLRGVLRHSQ
jgi:putative ABC transport system permease protein